MPYKIKEIFYSIQGEGYHSGRPAVFVRFAGCDLWTGREQDRSKALCQFCDTDFRGGVTHQTPEALLEAAETLWPNDKPMMVVFTGGEPTLQIDLPLLQAFRRHFRTIETHGGNYLDCHHHIDWITVSPKPNAPIKMPMHEIKLVYPQPELMPEVFASNPNPNKYLQPMDGPNREQNIRAAIEYCLAHPEWKLSLQIQKLTGIK